MEDSKTLNHLHAEKDERKKKKKSNIVQPNPTQYKILPSKMSEYIVVHGTGHILHIFIVSNITKVGPFTFSSLIFMKWIKLPSMSI